MLGDLFAAGDGDWVYGDKPVSTLPWDQIKIADFSNNFLHFIDQTIVSFPSLTYTIICLYLVFLSVLLDMRRHTNVC